MGARRTRERQGDFRKVGKTSDVPGDEYCRKNRSQQPNEYRAGRVILQKKKKRQKKNFRRNANPGGKRWAQNDIFRVHQTVTEIPTGLGLGQSIKEDRIRALREVFGWGSAQKKKKVQRNLDWQCRERWHKPKVSPWNVWSNTRLQGRWGAGDKKKKTVPHRWALSRGVGARGATNALIRSAVGTRGNRVPTKRNKKKKRRRILRHSTGGRNNEGGTTRSGKPTEWYNLGPVHQLGGN